MKNLFLSVVLLLTVSFAFATDDVEKILTVDKETFELTSSVELANADFTMDANAITLSNINSVNNIVDDAPGDIWIICVYLGDGWWYCEVYVEVESQ